MTYLDTSAMVKLYYPEKESEQVSAWVRAQSHSLLYSHLHELELRNAYSLKMFRGELKPEAGNALAEALNEDLKAHVLTQPVLNWERIFRKAVRLAEAHTARIGSRSLDLLHVAVAFECEYDSFLTFDERQEKVADAAGLNVVHLDA